MPEPKTILVVEEELKVRLLLRRSLEAAGYQVLVVESGQAAKHTLREMRVDAIIVSWELSELSGQELALWIRQQPPRIGRQLVIIGVGNVSPVIDSPSPVDAFVPRPCNPDEILAFLKRLLVPDKTLLLIDTEKRFREVATEWLEPLDFTMTLCANQEEALTLLAKHTFDCIVLGIHYDQLDDLRLRKAAREQQELQQSWVVLIVPLFAEVRSNWLTDGFWANVVMSYLYSKTMIQDAVLGRIEGNIPPMHHDPKPFHRTV